MSEYNSQDLTSNYEESKDSISLRPRSPSEFYYQQP